MSSGAAAQSLGAGERSAAGALALAVGAILWCCGHDLPFFGDANAWFDEVAHFDSPLRAFDRSLPLFRPAQHLVLWALVRLGLDQPAPALLLPLAIHVANALLLQQLAAVCGLNRQGRWLAVLTFLAFPSVPTLGWVIAISTPGRALSLLLALLAAAAYARDDRPRRGGILFAACLLPPLWHETGIVAAPMATLLVVALAPARRPWRDPWLLAANAAALAWALLVWLRPERAHGLRDLGALPANVAQATLAVAPDAVRLWLLDCLRGRHGGLGLGGGLAALAVLLTAGMQWLTRGSRLERCCLLAAAADLVLPVLTSGFCQRYVYFAAALLGIAAGAAAQPRGVRWPIWLWVLLVLTWPLASWQDLRESAQAGQLMRDVAADVNAARGRLPAGTLITLVDLPATFGTEKELSLFNWGARHALHRLGVAEPLRCVRTVSYGTSTDIPLLSAEEHEHLLAAPDGLVLQFDPATLRLLPVAGPR